jgi:gag-polyprotein putative aspartyl protease
MRRVTHSARFGGVVLAAVVALAAITGGARADDPSPDEALRQKGLVRTGTTYTFRAASDLSDRIAELDRRFAEWKRAKAGLDEQFKALGRLRNDHQDVLRKLQALTDRRPDSKAFGPRRFPDDGPHGPGSMPPPPNSGAFQPGHPPPPPDDMGGPGGPMADMMRQLGEGDTRRQFSLLNTERAGLAAEIVYQQIYTEDLTSKLEGESLEIERRRLEAVALDKDRRDRFDKLALDPQVKLDLAALSKRSEAPFSLGPLADYSKQLSELGNVLNESRLAMIERMAQFPLKGQNRLAGLVGLAEILSQELGTNAGRIQTLEREAASRRHLLAEQAKQHDKLSEDVRKGGGTSSQKSQLKAQLHAIDSRAETLRGERKTNRESLGKAHQLVASERNDYLRIVKALKDSIDEVDQEQRLAAIVAKPSEPDKRRPAAGRNANVVALTEPFKIKLREFEKAIRSEQVPIDVDKTIAWIEANLNGKPRKLMMIDVRIPEIRLSASLASDVGAQRIVDDPAVEITTMGGRTMRAIQGRLDNMTVGPFTLYDVACLILPESAGDVPSILGGDFFNRFSTKIDADLGKIILTELQVKPIHSSSKTASAKIRKFGAVQENLGRLPKN